MPRSSDPTTTGIGPAHDVRYGVIAAVVCLAFAAFTGHMWEDYLITFRASLNLATGHGLVFQPGERVHSFTSPLGTLLPAAFALGGGDGVEFRALWLFRVASALALGGGIVLAARAMWRTRVAPAALGMGCVALALDPKIIDYSINGMETAFLVLFILVSWRAFAEGPRLWACAAGLAGLQWTRPDGCVFFAVIGCGWLMCGAPGPGTLRAKAGIAVRGALLGILIYLPWVAFAWWYYGSPIPHTIVAKISPWEPGQLQHALLLYPWRLLFGHVALHTIFLPAYHFFGGWPSSLDWFSRLLAIGAAVAWLFPRVRAPGRLASAAFFLGGFYVEYIPRSPWYYPGWEAVGLIAWAYILDAALRTDLNPKSWIPRVGRIAGGLIVAAMLVTLVGVAWQMRCQQQIIETGNRTPLGKWLRANAAAGDRVYLEPLGYVGYYSQLKMYDYPGLSSPEVVAVRRAGKQPHAEIIAALQPDWLVLRPGEAQDITTQMPSLLRVDYRVARIFDVRAKVEAVKILPGRPYLAVDAAFIVYHRVAPKSP